MDNPDHPPVLRGHGGMNQSILADSPTPVFYLEEQHANFPGQWEEPHRSPPPTSRTDGRYSTNQHPGQWQRDPKPAAVAERQQHAWELDMHSSEKMYRISICR